MGYLVKNRRLQSSSSGVVLPTGSAADRPDSPNFGMMRYNTDSRLIEFFDGTIWNILAPGGAGITYVVDSFIGNGSTTAFEMSLAVASTQQIMVFVGSIYQNPIPIPPDYSAASYSVNGGTTLTFASPPPNTVPINVIHSST